MALEQVAHRACPPAMAEEATSYFSLISLAEESAAVGEAGRVSLAQT